MSCGLDQMDHEHNVTLDQKRKDKSKRRKYKKKKKKMLVKCDIVVVVPTRICYLEY